MELSKHARWQTYFKHSSCDIIFVFIKWPKESGIHISFFIQVYSVLLNKKDKCISIHIFGKKEACIA